MRWFWPLWIGFIVGSALTAVVTVGREPVPWWVYLVIAAMGAFFAGWIAYAIDYLKH